ncbi:hypothetical protein ACPD0J_001484 [Vibrio cholerae]
MRTETDKENDLTGQVDWDGTGLPPVGCRCVYLFNDEAEYSGFVAAYHKDAVWFSCDGGLYKTFIAINHEFRKPETPQQREERERIELERTNAVKDMFKLVPEHIKISMMPMEPNPIKEALFALYDAGYRINKDGE